MMENRLQEPYDRPAVKQAIAYGIDVTLLIENLDIPRRSDCAGIRRC